MEGTHTGPVWDLLRASYQLSKVPEKASLDLAYALTVEAARIAAEGSRAALWAYAMVAIRAADLGHWPAAEAACATFMDLCPSYPKDERGLLPWIEFALGTVYVRTHRRPAGLEALRRALALAEGELEERVRLYLVWTYCEDGQADQALAALPLRLQHLPEAYRRAALGRVAAGLGKWAEARRETRAILAAVASAPLYDRTQFRHLCDLLERHARQHGDQQEAEFWAGESARILTLRQTEALPPAEPRYDEGGGE